MKRVCFIKTIFSILLVFALFSCKKSDFFTITEYEQYLINLKLGILDKPALTVQHLPQKIYYVSSSATEDHYLYDFEFVSIPQENQRAIKDLDSYTAVFSAQVQGFYGQKIDAAIKEIKVVSAQKAIPVPLSETVSLKDSYLNFAQELLLKDFAEGLSQFSVVITLQTKAPEYIVLVPEDPNIEHLKSENVEVEYVECPTPSEEEATKTVTLTFKNHDGSVFQTLEVTPYKPIDAPTPQKASYDFVAWQGLPALCPTTDAVYEPIFKPTEYAITYMLNGGMNSRGNPDYFTVETPTFVLHPATKEGYVFEGWYKERVFRTRVTRVKQGTTDDMILYAKFSLPVQDGGQISLNKNQAVLYSGQTERLEATLVLQNGSSPAVMWTSSDEDVAEVDSLGNVMALNVKEKKTVVITASYSDLNASCQITVIPLK